MSRFGSLFNIGTANFRKISNPSELIIGNNYIITHTNYAFQFISRYVGMNNHQHTFKNLYYRRIRYIPSDIEPSYIVPYEPWESCVPINPFLVRYMRDIEMRNEEINYGPHRRRPRGYEIYDIGRLGQIIDENITPDMVDNEHKQLAFTIQHSDVPQFDNDKPQHYKNLHYKNYLPRNLREEVLGYLVGDGTTRTRRRSHSTIGGKRKSNKKLKVTRKKLSRKKK
jgi:hypothetical protein